MQLLDRRPTHPGGVLKSFLKRQDMCQAGFAEAIKMSRVNVNRLLNERGDMTANMAVRIAAATLTTPDFWLNMQRAVDLYDAHKAIGDELAQILPVCMPVVFKDVA